MIEHPDPADAQRARVEALRQRRASRAEPPASATGPVPRRRRRHVAARSRVGAAAIGVTTMLGLVGVMGLARPASSATTSATVPPAITSVPAPVAPAPVASPPVAIPTPAIATPPVALTARPNVQVTTPPTNAPAARTSGSR